MKDLTIDLGDIRNIAYIYIYIILYPCLFKYRNLGFACYFHPHSPQSCEDQRNGITTRGKELKVNLM